MSDDITKAKPSAPKAVGLRRWVMVQPMMTRVLVACCPAILGSVYFFGWRCLGVLIVVSAVGLACEGAFTWPKGKGASEAVFVTAVLYALILPPTIPFWMAAVGIAFAVVFGKMAFGGFGANIFNPAMTGRCFVYICFPVAMTARWAAPATQTSALAGLAKWGVDAVSMATPLDAYKAGETVDAWSLCWGNVAGSMGETSALLILLGAGYLLVTKTASWQIMAACLGGCIASSGVLHLVDPAAVAGPVFQVLAGGLLFGTVFMATDPVSASHTALGKWVYAAFVGALTVVMRGYSNFSCGFMFALLIANTFNPLLDSLITEWQNKRKPQASNKPKQGEGS